MFSIFVEKNISTVLLEIPISMHLIENCDWNCLIYLI